MLSILIILVLLRIKHQQSYIMNNMPKTIFRSDLLRTKRTMALFSEIRLLIQGTKNAYTTLRPHDVVFYNLNRNDISKDRGLGVYLPDKSVRPLCNYEQGSNKFYIDRTISEYPTVDSLMKDSKLIRIVSAEKCGDHYIIDEYIDSDVHIPILNQNDNKETVAINKSETTNYSEKFSSNKLKLLYAKLEVAKLNLEILEEQIGNEKTPTTRKTVIQTNEAPIPVGPYSQAIRTNEFIFLSGCIGINPITNKLVEGGIEAQTIQALSNLKAILKASESSVSKICKTMILMKNMEDYSIVNKLYAEFLSGEILPARTTFAAAMLPLNALVEIDVIALT